MLNEILQNTNSIDWWSYELLCFIKSTTYNNPNINQVKTPSHLTDYNNHTTYKPNLSEKFYTANC